MITETKEIYKCGFCRKLYQIRSYCVKHEIRCHKNPQNNRLCFGCKFLDKNETKEYFDTLHGENSRNVNLFYCNKLDHFLYPPKVEIDNKAIELGYEDNKPMRKECEYFKEKTWEDF